jgi:hypothetical protein
VSSNDRDTCRPRFFMEAVQNKSLSEKEGRPIFEDKEFVELKQPGDKHWSFICEVNDPNQNIPQRFPDQYAAFKRGEQRAAVGTPLEQWPPLTKSRVAELKACNILTVEEYAGVPDNVLSRLGIGAREEREQARAWLEAAKGGAANNAMAARIAQLEQMVERLSGTVTTPPEPKEKSIHDCTDAELKEFIKRETGEGMRGQPSRETLLARATELVEKAAA